MFATYQNYNKIEKILEKLSPEELDSIKGGTWVLTDKGWVWIEGAILNSSAGIQKFVSDEIPIL